MSKKNDKMLLDALGKMQEVSERIVNCIRILMSERDDLLAERNKRNEADTGG